MVMQPSDIRGNETRKLYHVEGAGLVVGRPRLDEPSFDRRSFPSRRVRKRVRFLFPVIHGLVARLKKRELCPAERLHETTFNRRRSPAMRSKDDSGICEHIANSWQHLPPRSIKQRDHIYITRSIEGRFRFRTPLRQQLAARLHTFRLRGLRRRNETWVSALVDNHTS